MSNTTQYIDDVKIMKIRNQNKRELNEWLAGGKQKKQQRQKYTFKVITRTKDMESPKQFARNLVLINTRMQ